MKLSLAAQSIMMLAWTFVAALPAGVDAESNGQNAGNGAAWGVSVGFHIQEGEVHHSMIEERVAAFQADNDLSTPWSFLCALGVRHRKYVLDVEWSIPLGPRNDFMDEDHYIWISDTYVLVWCRRIVPFSLGKMDFAVLPGAGVGYSWASAGIGKYDSEGPNEPRETQTVLEDTDVAFSIGINLECGGTLFKERGGLRGGFLEFTASYRFDDSREARTVNDGYFFFPGGSEFDFSGFYFGFGIVLRS